MAANVLVDAGFLVALLNPRDRNHRWAARQADSHPLPWITCEAVLSETFYLLEPRNAPLLVELLREAHVLSDFRVAEHIEATFRLFQKYADVPMSFADACLVRMTEVMDEPVLMTTDSDFHVYRRHGRQTIPVLTP